jgi:hypothetical protein
VAKLQARAASFTRPGVGVGVGAAAVAAQETWEEF